MTEKEKDILGTAAEVTSLSARLNHASPFESLQINKELSRLTERMQSLSAQALDPIREHSKIINQYKDLAEVPDLTKSLRSTTDRLEELTKPYQEITTAFQKHEDRLKSLEEQMKRLTNPSSDK